MFGRGRRIYASVRKALPRRIASSSHGWSTETATKENRTATWSAWLVPILQSVTCFLEVLSERLRSLHQLELPLRITVCPVTTL